MHEVFEYLSKIQLLLEQIENITDNQTTILVGDLQTIEEENNALEFIEQMVNCKDELIVELSKVEACFQEEYEKQREQLIKSNKIKDLKTQVERILVLKDEITRKEQQNMVIMQNFSKKKIDRMTISPSSNQVAAAYKKQQLKS
ncbi:MAG: hypothetical protein E7231_13110 [Cellulosilyticum sp.]|nr:hypothetical protein [Cellulosilyticum sp.]